jgi:DNA repair exonuclease SbcCD ATPase subunit
MTSIRAGRPQPGHHHHRGLRGAVRPDRRRCGQRIRHADHRRQCGAADQPRRAARSTSSSNEVQRLSDRARQSQRPDQPVPGRERRRPARRPAPSASAGRPFCRNAWASAQRELSSLIDQRARIIEIYEATGQIAAADNTLTDDQRQLRDLERELAQLLSIYSEGAPQIVTLRRRIDTLRTQVTTPTPAKTGPAVPARRCSTCSLARSTPRSRPSKSVIGEANAELERLEAAIARTPSTRSRCRVSNATTRISACNTTAPSRAWPRPRPANGSS